MVYSFTHIAPLRWTLSPGYALSQRGSSDQGTMEIFTPRKRSEIISRLRSTGTSPELKLFELVRDFVAHPREILRNLADIPGQRDILMPSLQLAFFVDQCLFHGCPLHFKVPKTNTDFWEQKASRNKSKDLRTRRRLRDIGFSVWSLWEHDIHASLLEYSRWIISRAVKRQLIEMM